jgi:hypothetical protein
MKPLHLILIIYGVSLVLSYLYLVVNYSKIGKEYEENIEGGPELAFMLVPILNTIMAIAWIFHPPIKGLSFKRLNFERLVRIILFIKTKK